MQQFGALLVEAISQAGLTMNGFAKLVHAGSSSISQISTGKRTPPLDQIDKWADVLNLKGAKRSQFLELAYISHCPKIIQLEYYKIKDKVKKLEDRISALEKELN